MRRLLLDAGPLIALFYAKDSDHQVCLSGFQQLIAEKVELIIPLPIVYEVNKWMLHNGGAPAARRAEMAMEQSLTFLYIDEALFEAVKVLQGSIPNWAGTLEDATVAVVALHHDCPVWTLNYRDLAAFQKIEFWNP